MDLMRTLLIYMSATMTLAVQNTTAPKETPSPAPAQDAIVETIETPAPGDETITATPAADTEQGTPLPVPLITPNMKGYHNLTIGAKGKEVKKLQEKLIELRYLPEGSADGGYGRKTFNAVKKFQHYNGLTADGIAGRRTQTNLFENPDVAANPEVTPIPEVTPAPPAEAPETISPPEVTEAPEKGTATEAPETEAPETEVPEAGTPETEAPETEEPETEEPETETPETEAPETEIPEETEEPDVSAEPEPEEEPDIAWDPDETEPDIIENVDLDAEVYEEITAAIALNESDGPLEFVTTEDGVPLTAKPRLSRNGNRIRVSLDDLCECVEKWKLTDDGVGSVVLEAAGYTLVIYNEDSGCSATVDGKQISMKDDDFDFMTDGHFIDAEFLASALKGEAVWEEEENTLMLRIRDREAVESAD